MYDYYGSLIRELCGLFLYMRDLRFCTSWWVCHAMGCHFLHYRKILLVWIHGVIRKEDCNFYLNIGVQIIKKFMASFIVIGLIQLTYIYLVGVLLLPLLLILLLQLPSHQVLLLKLLLLRSSYSAVIHFSARSQNYEKRLLASSCPSVRMEQLGSDWTNFDETSYFSFF